MPTPRDLLRDEAGFTLVELLTAMVLTLLLSFAVLTTLDSFSSNASRQTRVTDANGEVRDLMDRIVSDLRQARTIEVAKKNNLVYTVADSPTQTRRERMCRDSSGGLWRSSVKTATAPTVPISPGAACPIADSGAVLVTNLLSRNSGSNPMFSYDSATPADVRSVGMTIALDAGNAHNSDTTTLRASAFVRAHAEAAPPVSDGDIGVVCGSSGPLLNVSSGVGTLTVKYTDLNGVVLGSNDGSALQLPLGAEKIVVTVTSAGGGVTQLLKTLAC